MRPDVKYFNLGSFMYPRCMPLIVKHVVLVNVEAVPKCCVQCHLSDEPQSSVFDREVQRLGFDLKSAWRITHANSEFK